MPRAIEFVETALRIDPTLASAHELRADLLRRTGRLREAGDALVSAGKIDPQSKTVRRRMAGLAGADLSGVLITCGVALAIRASADAFMTLGVGQAWAEWGTFGALGLWLVAFPFYLRRRRVRQMSPSARSSYEASRL